MILVVLGSGTCVPSKSRNAPGYLVETAERSILLDCGSGILRQLARAGRTPLDLDAVLVTHLHPDHMADLLPLLQALKFSPGRIRQKPLHLVGPGNLQSYFRRGIFPVVSAPRAFELVFEGVEKPLQQGDCLVHACPTAHSGEGVAFRLTSGEWSVVITGDTDSDPALPAFCRGADLLVADCSFPDEMKMVGHMGPRECGRLARDADIQHLVLSHLYPTSSPESDRVRPARAEFAGRVSLAEDFAEYTLQHDSTVA